MPGQECDDVGARVAENVRVVADSVGAPLTMEHRASIEAALRTVASPFAEFSFPNLYLFRGLHNYHFIDGPSPFLTGVTYDGVVHALPLGPVTVDTAVAMLSMAPCLYPVSEGDALRLGEGWSADFNDDDSDYIYDIGRLADLSGVAKAKRKQARDYAAAWHPRLVLHPDRFEQLAQMVLERWLDDSGRDVRDTDFAACGEAIALSKTLGLEQAIVFSGDEPHGFLLAQRLTDGSKAIHFAKARRDIPGVSPFLFSAFARVAGTTRLNFEQDLGKTGFRQAKRAFGPVGRLRKYRVYREGPCLNG